MSKEDKVSGWKKVGNWLKENGGATLGLVGSLATGNIPGAIAAGSSMISSATGTDDPIQALATLQADPNAMIRLKEIAMQEEQNIRKHLEEMTRLELEDQQHEHATTQETIQGGDKADDKFVRWTRPGQSWLSLAAAITYVFVTNSPEVMILGALLTLPFTYAGLRGVDKGINAFTQKGE